ncbi:enoyl-CoA hydratase/carnithine racemase [Tamaricihabitans halophyticus]|uniref:Enoyl-CoA hydratase/carnithine racemase n=1 Tax=Tamaricihabitans halophyticus TaxID=1262583 RepID=A0A4R2QKR3_9PSEU|nr:enoyl-CoA hydratase-related protein [Tamaricihabitans halophyticus]TCP50033.1 enoyl-CoA hydratase/carnithine racemase [Tamaricihabitans halophyticus]
MADQLVVERAGAIATIVLNRPESHNAITLGMYQEIPSIVSDLDSDTSVKVVVVRGAGERSFASGADITEFEAVRGNARDARQYNEYVARAEQALTTLRKPSLAMVHGYCIGGGCGLALACDIRLADERARFAITPAKLGLVYSLDSTKRLVDLVGPARAKWVLMSGKQLTADDARSWGLVEYVLPAEELAGTTYELAAEIGTRAQFSVRASKEIVTRIGAGQHADDEYTTNLRNSSFDTEDYAEGVRAFLGKRAPNFTWS